MWCFIHYLQRNLQRIIDSKKRKQMAEFDDVNLDTSSNEGDFEGFTPEDVIKAIEKGVQLKQIDDVDLSFISFDEDDGDQLTSENETDSDNDEADEWHDASTQIHLPQFTAKDGPITPALNFQHINYLFYLVHPGNIHVNFVQKYHLT